MMGMTNEQVLEFNQGVIETFRTHAGVMPEGSPFHRNPTLLMTMTGAKSGRSLTSPLSYATDDDGALQAAELFMGGDVRMGEVGSEVRECRLGYGILFFVQNPVFYTRPFRQPVRGL